MSLLTRVRAAIAGAGIFFIALVATTVIWLSGARNPYTPAGYVGYLTKGAFIGHSRFYGVQRGPTSAGRGWLLDVTNVSVTPYTYSEEFVGDSAVMSRDNLKIGFRVHTVWRVDANQVPLFMERYSTTVDRESIHRDPDAVVKVAYANFVKEPMRTFSLDEVQRRNGLEVKDALIAIGDAVLARIRSYASGSPFIIDSVVVGNVQYPEEVANAMEIIRGQLSGMYIQHEAIEAQKAMVGSPNHTVVYIPVGPMGVPITATMESTQTVKK